MATDAGGSVSLGSEPFYDFQCSVCSKDDKHTEGERFCVECNETFCTSCLVFHNKIAIMRPHELVDKTKMATRRPSQYMLQQPTSRCAVHSNQVINMYCEEDDLVCCTVCIAEDHKTCNDFTYIPKAAKNIKTGQEFQEVNAAIGTMKADIEMLKKGKTLDLHRITAQHSNIQEFIVKLRDQIKRHLDDLEKTARNELDRRFKIHEDEINKDFVKLEKQMSKLDETAIKLKDGQNESQLFIDMKEAKKKENEGRKLIEDVELLVGKPALHFELHEKIKNIFEIKTFGILEDQKSINFVSYNRDIDVKSFGDDKICDLTGACQMFNGSIAITDMENEKLKLLDREYKIIAECKLSGRPRNVCRTSPTEVAIAMANVEKVIFAEVTDKISLKGSFSVGEACRGIAYNAGLLYVICGGDKEGKEGPGQVRVYDMAGNILQTFMKDKYKQKLFSIPVDIVLSECRTKLHIADEKKGIVTMNLDGTGRWKFENPDMKFPNGISVVNNDDLIVSGCNSNNVILFDKTGQKKAILLKEEDRIGKPRSVFYDRPSSKLIVSIFQSNHIKVYNLL